MMLRVAVSSVLTRDDGEEEILQIPGCLIVKKVKTGELSLCPPQQRSGFKSWKAVVWSQEFEERIMGIIRRERPDLLKTVGPTKEYLTRKNKKTVEGNKYATIELEG